MSRASRLCFERRVPLERYPLTDLPTPVRRLEALERETGAPSLWVKCDDRSGGPYGGNKPRKLEYLVAEALRRGRKTLLTSGGIGTHHGLATAIAARKAGLRAVLVLLPQPITNHVRESLLLLHAYGAEMHLAESVPAVASRIVRMLSVAALRGEPMTLIPTGGTNALGVSAFVRAAFELAAQIEARLLPEPDAIFVALGSGGTSAGLVAGLRAAGLRTRVISVLVTHTLPPGSRRLSGLANASIRLMRRRGETLPELRIAPHEIEIERAYLGGGYGVPTEAGEAATRLASELEGIALEPTYTAKAFAAFVDAARSGRYGEHILFWNTFSSIDPRAGIERLPDPAELPAAFHRFLS